MIAEQDQPVAAHPRTMGWIGTTALAISGSNQSLFLLAALIAGQGSAAIPLLIVGLLLSWAAAPGWTELILMWPNRVGGIAAACSEAFRPYNPLLAALTGTCYWWGWVPTCGLTALLSASAIQQWFAPLVSIPWLASGIVAFFVIVNLCGIRWVVRLAIPIAVISAILALISALAPVLTGHVDWVRAASFHLNTPFAGPFGALTSVMAGIYLIGFAAPAFEAAACHVGETIDPARNVPRAMIASALMAALYFVILPIIWLGMFGPAPLARDLAVELGPTFAPVFGGAAKAAAVGFMVFNMFPGTVQPLAGASRTLSQLAEDGLLPRALALRNRADVPWVATLATAAMSIVFLWLGDPVWLIAAANFTYLIGICMPSVAVWLLRRDAPDMPRPYRAGRGMIGLGVVAAVVWLISAILGFEQFGISTVIIGLAFACSGTVLFAWRRYRDRRRAGLPGLKRSLHLTLTGTMLMVLVLDAAGYLLAVSYLPVANSALVSVLQDIFVAVTMLTITVGLVLPGIIAHSVVEVSNATKNLVSGKLLDFTQAMEALGNGDLGAVHVEFDYTPVDVRSRDEIGELAATFNELQREIQRSAIGLVGARKGLGEARKQLLDSNHELEDRIAERSELVDALTQARDAAEAASGAKGRFVALMSHEIRTPMNGVLTTIDLLSHSDLSPAQRKLITIIERSGATLLALANEVLDYAKVDAGNDTAQAVGFDLIELVTNRFDEMAAQATRSALDFRLVLPADRTALPVVSDPRQLTLVLQNVIANALKFTEHGFVEVQLRVCRETADSIDVELCISDSGIGMSDAFKLRLFEPFSQANETTTRRFGGAGLGLSIVKEIVDLLGGGITVTSQIGQGTTIQITWTVARSLAGAVPGHYAQPGNIVSASADPPNDAIYPPLILVAEDNFINQEVIAASLTRLGHVFVIVDDGAAAVAAFAEGNFGLVLMDCRMPVMDGFAASRTIRNHEAEGEGRRIPILAITANASPSDRALCQANGMDDLIAKPFTMDELKQKLERWLPHPRVQGDKILPLAAAPTYNLLNAETLRAFNELQMPGQPSIIIELIDSFYRTAPEQLQQVEWNLADGDVSRSILAAHGMKSASAAIGLTALAEKFRIIEKLLESGNNVQVVALLPETWQTLHQSLAELSVFMANCD